MILNLHCILILIGLPSLLCRGLMVPVLRDCDRLSFADIEKGLNELSNKARKNAITTEEMVGGMPTW